MAKRKKRLTAQDVIDIVHWRALRASAQCGYSAEQQAIIANEMFKLLSAVGAIRIPELKPVTLDEIPDMSGVPDALKPENNQLPEAAEVKP